MSAGVKERQAGSVTVLEVSGKLTIGAEAAALDEKLQSLIRAGQLALLVDCSQVSDIDSRGIQVLVRGVTSASKGGGKLKLLKISPRIRGVLNITHLLTVIECFDDEGTSLQNKNER